MARKSRKYRFERRRAKRMQPVPFKDSYGVTVNCCRRKNGDSKNTADGRRSIVALFKRAKRWSQDRFITSSSTKLSR
jgi:hypothetical protein